MPDSWFYYEFCLLHLCFCKLGNENQKKVGTSPQAKGMQCYPDLSSASCSCDVVKSGILHVELSYSHHSNQMSDIFCVKTPLNS